MLEKVKNLKIKFNISFFYAKKKYEEELKKTNKVLKGEKSFIDDIEKDPNLQFFTNTLEKEEEKDKKKSLEDRISECKKYKFKLENLRALRKEYINKIDKNSISSKCKVFVRYILFLLSFLFIFTTEFVVFSLCMNKKQVINEVSTDVTYKEEDPENL